MMVMCEETDEREDSLILSITKMHYDWRNIKNRAKKDWLLQPITEISAEITFRKRVKQEDRENKNGKKKPPKYTETSMDKQENARDMTLTRLREEKTVYSWVTYIIKSDNVYTSW